MATSFLLVACSAQMTEKEKQIAEKEKLIEKVIERFPNGQVQVVRYYDENNNCVKETEYFDTGVKRMEGGMKNGKMEGEWTSYYRNGQMQSHGFYKDGKRTGYAVVYNPDGSKFQEGSYTNGKHCGHWIFYNEQGNQVGERDFGKCE